MLKTKDRLQVNWTPVWGSEKEKVANDSLPPLVNFKCVCGVGHGKNGESQIISSAHFVSCYRL